MNKGIKGLINLGTPRYYLDQLLDEALIKSNDESRVGDYFHPSSIGQCLRFIQFSMNGMVSNVVDSTTQRIFDNGHDVHTRYKRYFKRIGRLVGEEVPVRIDISDIIITGHADIIVRDLFDGKRLLEIKSINNRGFEDVCSKNAPKIEHFLQWNIYSVGLHISNGDILYENKDNQKVKYFPVTTDKEKFAWAVEQFKTVQFCNDRGETVPMPDRCPNDYCRAKALCDELNQKKKGEKNGQGIPKNI
jgi:hypothetical protein